MKQSPFGIQGGSSLNSTDRMDPLQIVVSTPIKQNRGGSNRWSLRGLRTMRARTWFHDSAPIVFLDLSSLYSCSLSLFYGSHVRDDWDLTSAVLTRSNASVVICLLFKMPFLESFKIMALSLSLSVSKARSRFYGSLIYIVHEK